MIAAAASVGRSCPRADAIQARRAGAEMDRQRRSERLLLVLNAILLVLVGALALWTVWSFIPKPWRDLDPDAMPRPVAARGDLAEIEQTTIEVFRAAAPSVVHITTLVTAAVPFSLDVQ